MLQLNLYISMYRYTSLYIYICIHVLSCVRVSASRNWRLAMGVLRRLIHEAGFKLKNTTTEFIP